MATVIDDIVQVTITRESSAISRAGFSRPCYVSVHTRFAERTQIYTGSPTTILLAMIGDGFETTDVAYLQASAALAVSPAPNSIMIGRAVAPVARVIDFQVTTVANSTSYSITLNGVAFAIMSDGSATAPEIQAALIAAIQGGSQASVLSATAVSTDTVRVTSDVAGLQFTYSNTANLTATVNAAGNGPVEDMVAIAAEAGEDFIAFAFDTRTPSLMLALAAWAEPNGYVYSNTNSDADVAAGTGGNVLERLGNLSYRNTFYTFNDPSQERYIDCAYLARGLVFDLDAANGQGTWSMKTLAGQEPDVLTGAERDAIQSANGNTYERRAGKNITRDGKMVGGEFIDITLTIMWVRSRMVEDIFATLSGTATKIPYTQGGLDVLEATIRRRLQIAVDNGHFSSFTLTMPTIDDELDSDIEARTVRNISWTAVPAGAIHRVIVQGNVAV